MEDISSLTQRECKEINGLYQLPLSKYTYNDPAVISNTEDISGSNVQMLYQLLSFMLVPFLLLFIAINSTAIYTHIDAESLPKQLAGPTLNTGGKNIVLSPYKQYFSEKDVHNGDYLVVTYDFHGSPIARAEVPLKAGEMKINSFRLVKDINDKLNASNDLTFGWESKIIHTKKHTIIDWDQLMYVGDAASLLSLITILNFNVITRRKRESSSNNIKIQ